MIVHDGTTKMEYHGISQPSGPFKPGDIVAIVTSEGEHDLWLLDNDKDALTQLMRYCAADGFDYRITLATCY